MRSVALLRKTAERYEWVQCPQIGTGKTNGAGMLTTWVRGTDCHYLAPLIRLKELAVVGKFLAYYRDR